MTRMLEKSIAFGIVIFVTIATITVAIAFVIFFGLVAIPSQNPIPISIISAYILSIVAIVVVMLWIAYQLQYLLQRG